MRGLTLIAGIAVALAAGAATASAATLEVTKTGDPAPGACTRSDCSLREAVRRANATTASDRIVLRARTYRIEQIGVDDDALAGDLDVVGGSGRLTISGKSVSKTTIDGNDVDRILHVLAGARLMVSGLTLRDGHASNGGGALQNDGSTVIQRSAVRSNTADNIGGGLHNNGDGNLTVKRTRITGNDAAARGGGVHTYNTANATLTRVVIASNEAARGAALYNENDSVLSVRRAKIRGNDAANDGGALYNNNTGRVTFSRSKLTGNTAVEEGGAIYNNDDGRLAIGRTTISGNRTLGAPGGPSLIRGGGIFTQNDTQTRITNSTISGNRTLGEGGGIYIQNNAAIALTNTTVSGNRAAEGGAIYANNYPYIRINFTTIAKNRADVAGGAIYDQTAGNSLLRPPPFWLMRGALIAKNSSPGVDNCALDPMSDAGHYDSQGSNLEDENSCFFDRGSDQRNAKAKLRRLARNGGPTKTHALRRSSDAVNAVRRRGCPGKDQRGVRRPQGRRCDVGAYELKQP